jgi:hypothetical protein
MEMTTYLHQVLRVRMDAVVPPLTPHIDMIYLTAIELTPGGSGTVYI